MNKLSDLHVVDHTDTAVNDEAMLSYCWHSRQGLEVDPVRPAPGWRTVFLFGHCYGAWKLCKQFIHGAGATFGQACDYHGGVADLYGGRAIFVVNALSSLAGYFIACVVWICRVVQLPETQVLSSNDTLLGVYIPVHALIRHFTKGSSIIEAACYQQEDQSRCEPCSHNCCAMRSVQYEPVITFVHAQQTGTRQRASKFVRQISIFIHIVQFYCAN